MKKQLSTFLFILVFLVGVSLLLYPGVSDRWNARVQSEAVVAYDEAAAEMDGEDTGACLAKAHAYNERLRSVGSAAALSEPDLVEGYADTLDITGTGIMGYITIDRIHVELPIYHGTSSGVLSRGAGHLEGSSLPVGGEGTHAVISAHRGLPSARLFTNLDQLEVGDTFLITILDEVLTYEVDQIRIVLPSEPEDLYIEDGMDVCTLMTCTPYGINTHRLLVRGVRTDTADTPHIRIAAEARRIHSLFEALVLAVPIFGILLIWNCRAAKHGKRRAMRPPEDEEKTK